MFIDASLESIEQSIEDINAENRRELAHQVGSIPNNNLSALNSYEVLWSEDTLLMYNFLNFLKEFKKLNLRFNRIAFRSEIESTQERTFREIKQTLNTQYSTTLLYMPSGIVKGLEYINSTDDIKKATRLKNIELALIYEKRHIVNVYKIEKSILIVTNRYSWNFLRKTISLLPIMHDITIEEEDVKEIFKNYGALDYEGWVNAFNNWFAKHDLKTERIKNELYTLFKNKSDKQLNKLEKELNSTLRIVEDYEASIKKYYKQVEEYKTLIRNFKLSPSDEENIKDVLNYLMNNKKLNISDVKVSDNVIKFEVIESAKYYDNQFLIKYLEKDTVINSAFAKRLLKEIYIDGIYDLLFYTKFYINIIEGTVSYCTPSNESFKAFPHPHIMNYNCWGDNRTYITKAIVQNDYMGALEQCLAACYNLNFSDSIVIERFGRDINNLNTFGKIKCIKDANGNMFTPLEMYKKYKEEVKENKE